MIDSGDAAAPRMESDAFAADLLRGHTDTIMLGVLRDGENYGFEIYKVIRDAAGGEYEIKETTLYATIAAWEGTVSWNLLLGDETQGGRRNLLGVPTTKKGVQD